MSPEHQQSKLGFMTRHHRSVESIADRSNLQLVSGCANKDEIEQMMKAATSSRIKYYCKKTEKELN